MAAVGLANPEDVLPMQRHCPFRLLARYSERQSVRFHIGGAEIPAAAVFQPEAFGPVIAIEAERVWRRMEGGYGHGASLGITLSADTEAMFGVNATFPVIGTDVASTMRILAIIEGATRVLGLAAGADLDLAKHIEAFDQIDWYADGLPSIPLPEDFNPDFRREANLPRTEKESHHANPNEHQRT
ncbi:hypothetical protein K2O51_31240 (plasmid) [Cupriavidus pinatubonensis]|uniref:hypothetical protein n=1 Tax=Cupriavidus pinatubonensis TaxID=248026 RepID=UPI001C736C29|nr:hypothetical protein [Cupriavidus pinatubonensis]QYY33719.1 hypothetical protein K2O51_31240 [Cupriavidus pinatubonensis]